MEMNASRIARTGGPLLLACLLFLSSAQGVSAAIAFGAIGTASAIGSTSVTIPYPTGVAAGNLLVMAIFTKYAVTPTLPGGWQNITNGQGTSSNGGANGLYSGTLYTTVFVRVADGTESGNVVVSVPSGTTALGYISRYTKGSGTYWDIAATNGQDANQSTPWSATAAANPGITAGDLMLAISGDMSGAFTNHTVEAMSATGATFGTMTEDADIRITTGGGGGLIITRHPVTAGTASAAPVFTMTSNAADSGVTLFVRLRETTNPSPSITVSVPTTVTGSVAVAGAVAKGSGTFVIDHPLDPKNKLLYHSFVESPDAMNVYDGIAQLDDSGRATIQLPDYFLGLNTNFQYLLTAIGQAMPGLYISGEVHRRWWLFGPIEFTVAGGAPGGKVSWQVTGVRHDPFILANPIVPIVEKGPNTPVDRGAYLCPECYVQQ
jgi:hypothetical protein